MIRVGFLGEFSNEWVGGLNYIRNLLYAVQADPQNEIQPIVFISSDMKPEFIKSLSQYAEVVETSLLRKKSLNWFIWRVTKKLFHSDFWIEIVLRKYKIDVFSHSHLYRLFFSKTINWIPDFQHLRLPKMFSGKEIKARNKSFLQSIQFADLVILSSKDAFSDFQTFAPKYINKVKILRFVAQPNRGLLARNPEKEAAVLEKYGLKKPYFFLPNQFWKHKNHQVVFEAVDLLKKSGVEISLVCTGQMSDYRNEQHISELKNFVSEKSVNVKLLGLIDYDDVIVLMNCSRAVLNPSLFEGWSSTVEECKAIGKQVLLSDIPVHREQDPPQAVFFDPYSGEDLAKKLKKIAEDPEPILPEVNLERETLNFSRNYQAIVHEALDENLS